MILNDLETFLLLKGSDFYIQENFLKGKKNILKTTQWKVIFISCILLPVSQCHELFCTILKAVSALKKKVDFLKRINNINISRF